jgi:hypothetical protein
LEQHPSHDCLRGRERIAKVGRHGRLVSVATGSRVAMACAAAAGLKNGSHHPGLACPATTALPALPRLGTSIHSEDEEG